MERWEGNKSAAKIYIMYYSLKKAKKDKYVSSFTLQQVFKHFRENIIKKKKTCTPQMFMETKGNLLGR